MKSYSVQVKEFYETTSIALLVNTASQFKSFISIRQDNKTANAKSIMGLISLGLTTGQEICVMAEGEDEERAAEEVLKFFSKVERNNF